MLASYKEHLRTLEEILCNPEYSSVWQSSSILCDTYKNCIQRFEVDYDLALKSLSYMTGRFDDVDFQTSKTQALMQEWNREQGVFNIPALIAAAIDFLNIHDPEDIRAMFVAAILAEVPTGLPYHDVPHFRKVVLHSLRMIAAHQNIHADTRTALSKNAQVHLLLAACIHDLGHKGQGNLVDGQYDMARTEKRSFEFVKPYFTAVGLSDDALSDIRVMLIGTDTTLCCNSVCPSQQVRSIYQYLYGDASEMDLTLISALSTLSDRRDLTLLCMMLHEADIMSSAGIGYEQTLFETIAIGQEIGQDATPETILAFIKDVCCYELLTDSGRYLGQQNLDDIHVRVTRDFEAGNHSYS